MLTTPVTPVTPVSAEAFRSLQDLIIEQDARALDDANKQDLERHLQKLTRAAQTSIARNVLQQERIQFLLSVNNEAKVRRSTKSIVLGKAKVMSYEDLAAARTKRMEKEASESAKKKPRGRKRKGGAQVTNVQGTGTETASPDEGLVLSSVPTQAIGTEPMEGLSAPCLGRAPVARMW